MKTIMKKTQAGLSLIEMMIALGIALFLMSIALGIFVQETGLYKTSGTQASIQSAENAISALVAPAIRSAGFMGCSSLGYGTGIVNELNIASSPPPPLGALPFLPNNAPAGIFGYDALISAVSTPLTIAENAVNDTSAADWSPALDASLVGKIEPGSDVLVLLGPVPGSQPVVVVGFPNNASLTLSSSVSASDLSYFSNNQWAAISDCNSTFIFQITNGANTPATAALPYAPGSGALTDLASVSTMVNIFGTIPITLTASSPTPQVIPLQQTAFFVAKGNNGQSTLMSAVLGLTTTGSVQWTVTPLVPGVDNMQVLYGISAAGSSAVVEYVPASGVTSWASVHSVRMSFLLAGQLGSLASPPAGAAAVVNNMLGTVVNIPADSRLRHLFEITVFMRNAS